LAWHNDLRDESPGDVPAFVDAGDLDDLDRVLLAAKLSLLKTRCGDAVPYGFDCINISFDTEGKLLPTKASAGLTCATFLSKVMEGFGFPILKAEEWLKRDDDTVWQSQIIELLRRAGCEERAKVLAGDVGDVRYRPEEVVGAAGTAPWPVGFDSALAAAQGLLDELASMQSAGARNGPDSAS
jgi:hypothetical protein